MKFYNTLTREQNTLTPINNKTVTLYTCGLTVYSQPHIGNWVSYIYWDVLTRALKAEGYDVKRVQNITDVGHLTSDEDAGEDKMLKSALKEGTTAWDVADKYIKIAEHEGFDLLGLIRPDFMPRATEYIPQQIAFVEQLESKGYTYKLDDGIYFDTSKLEHYGALAKLDIEGLRFGARVADTGKKNPTDFAVWKFSNPAEKRDMEWDSPWGKGFPGWHLECSVMARELLGDQIDIHTGGIDHIPVHHVNEIAQTEAVTGKQFANIWMHANHIKVDGTKMSKSLGNIYTLQDIIDKKYDLAAFKLLVLSKHYRTEGNFTWDILDSSQNRLNKWLEAADLQWQENMSEDASVQATLADDIKQALADDLNTPAAVASIDAYVNQVLDLQFSKAGIEAAVKAMDTYLGISLTGQHDIADDQKKLIADRSKARAEKDWAKSDELRDVLKEQGIAVRDTEQGQIWSRIR